MSSMESASPASAPRRGALFGLLAAALFGLSAPLAKRLLGETTPQVLAGLLYLGSGIGLSVVRIFRRPITEAPLSRGDVPTLAAVAISGGVLGPLLMLIGLGRVSALAGSLLLNLEGPFTMAIAVLVFREHLGRYGVIAAGCILLGAALLRFQPGTIGVDTIGMLAIAAACLCWAIDNNLTQRLSLRDPFAIVRIKSLTAGSFNLLLGLLLAGSLPRWPALVAALVLGAFSYGASVVLDAYALRLVGAAREAAYFATAPFVGALASLALLRERLELLDAAAMGLMALGVVALLRERHSHRHVHEVLDHSHQHVHDEHHRHGHGPNDPPGEPHSHEHHHDRVAHEHPHVPDAHHRHKH
jgi:drug/metabolite transporter (DMT)-like permease